MDEQPITKKMIGRVHNFKNRVNYSQMKVNQDNNNKINIVNSQRFILNPQDAYQYENESLRYKHLVIPKLNEELVKKPRISFRESKYLQQRIQTQQKQIQLKGNPNQKQNPLTTDKIVPMKDKGVCQIMQDNKKKRNKVVIRKFHNSYQKEHRSIMNHRRRYESRGNEEDTEEMRTPKKDLKQGYFIDEKRLKTLDVKMNSLFSQNSESANERKKCNQYMHTISHITELYEIQRIYRGLFPGDQVKINIKIPKLVFMLKNQLKNKGRMEHRFILNICRELDIELEYVIVEKTPNTIFIGDTNKCLMFEQDSIYIGEWIKVSKHKKCRHGVGMEWVPSKHLFYGEFQYNIKKGLGIIKQQLSIFIGIWDNDLQGSKGYIIKEDGRVEESRGRVIKTETQIHKLQTLLGG